MFAAVLLGGCACAAPVPGANASRRELYQKPPKHDPNWKPPDPMAIATWRNSGHDTEKHDESEIEPEDYLWQNLPGRCCFSGHWDNNRKGKDGGPLWVSIKSCDQCDIWGQPDATCHKGKAECTTCGMDLYCEGKPPPLLGGAKVCSGSSRIGEGCFDSLKMGVCMMSDLNNCMDACHQTENCEMVIFYTQEMKGSCVLCSDLQNTEPTPHETTRIYARTPAPPPPSEPRTAHRGYLIDNLPTPPPPAKTPPSPPSPPPTKLEHMGWRAKQHFDCSFETGVEFTVNTPIGYTDKHASSRLECCNTCGLHAGCKDFVFQPSTGLCVLLPEVPASEIARLPNAAVVSGSVSVAVLRQETLNHGECVFKPGSGYTRGELGLATVPKGQKPITTKQDCCDACMADEQCAKFSFRPDSAECQLYQPLAEEYSTDGLISGILTARYLASGGHASGIAAGQRAIAGGQSGGLVGEMIDSSFTTQWPPMPPALFAVKSPPPLPPPDAGSITQNVLGTFSIGMGGLMAMGFLMCAYCFFAQDVKKLLGMEVKQPFDKPGAIVDTSAALPTKKKGKKKKKEGEEDISVTVEMPSITQTKDVALADCLECADLVELLSMLSELFPAVLRDKRKEKLLLLCRTTLEKGGKGAKAAGEADGWMLVTRESDISQVLTCPALKLTERPADFSEDAYTLAFVPDGGVSAMGKRAKARRAAMETATPAEVPPKVKGAAKSSKRDEDARVGLLAGAEEEDNDEAYERAAAEAAAAAAEAAAVAQAAAEAAAARRREKMAAAEEPKAAPLRTAKEAEGASRGSKASNGSAKASRAQGHAKVRPQAANPACVIDQEYDARDKQRRSMAKGAGLD